MAAWAYYNDCDPFCVAWLRELIKAGEIPDGEVDGRSILEVRSEDVAEFHQCHFFAGIGGWPLAFRLAGIEEAEGYWSGSCPCQPLSIAGSGKGHADSRHLWPAFHNLVAQRRPAAVFGEQVASKLGYEWLAGIRADLEAGGYACGAANLPACSKGAPHIRYRNFWVAYADQQGIGGRGDHRSGEGAGQGEGRARERSSRLRAAGELADAGRGRQPGKPRKGQARTSGDSENGELPRGSMAHPDGGHASEGRQQRSGQHGLEPDHGSADGAMGHASGARSEGGEREALSGARRWEEGRTASQSGGAHPEGMGHAQGGRRGIIGLADIARDRGHAYRAVPIYCADHKWRRVPADETGNPEPLLFPLAHGIPNRLGMLRGAGNAIHPQVAAQFIAAAEEARISSEVGNG